MGTVHLPRRLRAGGASAALAPGRVSMTAVLHLSTLLAIASQTEFITSICVLLTTYASAGARLEPLPAILS